jgi:hypothetical protein
MRHKGLHVGRCADARQGYFDRNADQRHRAEPVELQSAGADVSHSAKVEIEVADIGAVGINLGLLANHDIIDQARGPRIVGREPWHTDARHVLLKPFQ